MRQALIFVLILLIPAVARAGWISRCAERLGIVTDDPAPYSELDAATLLHAVRVKRDTVAIRELVFRYRVGMLQPHEAFELLTLIGLKQEEAREMVNAK